MLFFSFGNRAFNKEFCESNIYVVVSPKYLFEDKLSFLDKAIQFIDDNDRFTRSENVVLVSATGLEGASYLLINVNAEAISFERFFMDANLTGIGLADHDGSANQY